MTTKWMDPATQATFGQHFWDISGGTVESVNSPLKYGIRSTRLSGANSQLGRTAVMADAGRRVTFWVYFDGVSTLDNPITRVIASNGSDIVFQLFTDTTGQFLSLSDGGGNRKTGTVAILPFRWYRIAFSYVIVSASNWTVNVYLTETDGKEGTLALSASNADFTLTFTSGTEFRIFNGDGANFPSNFSPIYIDDGTNLTDPGDVRVTAKRPFSNGTTNGFTTQIGSGGSGYGSGHAPQVNERPLDTANGWSIINAGSVVTEEYNIEARDAGDIALPVTHRVLGQMGWVYTDALLAETGQLILKGADTPISITTTPTLFTVINDGDYPPGSGADIGEKTDATVTTVNLYEAGILVAYLEPLAGAPSRMLFQY